MNENGFIALALICIDSNSTSISEAVESFLRSRGWERVDHFKDAWTKFLDVDTTESAELEVLDDVSECGSGLEFCSVSYAFQIGTGAVSVGTI